MMINLLQKETQNLYKLKENKLIKKIESKNLITQWEVYRQLFVGENPLKKSTNKVIILCVNNVSKV